MSDMERIEALVDEVIARRGLDKALRPPPPRFAFLRHPLTITLVSFLLTSVIGVLVDQALTERREERARLQAAQETIRSEEEEARAAVQNITRLAYERSLALDLLRSAIVRGAGEEAVAKKAAYDAAYLAWNIALPESVEVLRRLANPSAPVGERSTRGPGGLDLGREVSSDGAGGFAFVPQTLFETALVDGVGLRFRSADACVTAAYDTARRANYAPLVGFQNEACPAQAWSPAIQEEMNALRACAYSIGTAMNALQAKRRGARLTHVSNGRSLESYVPVINPVLLDALSTPVAADCGSAG